VDEPTQVIEPRRRRNRAEVAQLAAEYETSGLSRTDFCRKRGLSLSTLARYRKRQTQGNTTPAGRWLEVEVSGQSPAPERGAASGLTVALPSGRRIEVARGFDARTLAQLLAVLERV
jgi:hypothetical protein